MSAPTICAVSGTCRGINGTAQAGVIIKANSTRPFIHPTDNSLVTAFETTTTSANDGTWSLNLIETTTPNVTLSVTFYFSTGANNPNDRKEYTIMVPNQASATFQSLIGSQI